MNSQYNKLLEEAKLKGSNLAKDYIPRLYRELVEVEKLDPHDAGERIKKDLVDTWARTTIYENLPEEAKQEAKQEAGRQSHKKVLEVSATNIGAEDSITNDHEPDTFGLGVVEESESKVPPHKEEYLGDVLEQYKKREAAQKQDYDKLAEQYNKTQEKLEGLQANNEYLEEEQRKQIEKIEQLGQVVQALQEARPNLVGATMIARDSKVQQDIPTRNPNRGYWIRFDLSNVEITRPLINIIMRMKDRPKQFYVEILGDDVIDVSETKA